VIVLREDGSEVTRLSSAAAADKLAKVLQVAAGRTMPAEELLQRAERDPKALSSEDWQLLIDFDWQNDPRHFAEPARAVAVLDRLAKAAPGRAQQHRFALLAVLLGTGKGEDGKYALTDEQQSRIATVALQILGNKDEVIANRQELSYQLPELIAALPPTPERAILDTSLITALDEVYADEDLPIPDRLATANADITIATRDGGEVHRTVLGKVRERVAWADKTATDAMVRQSVISTAAGLLADAGDNAGARRLLEAELKRSASPYYYMLDLSRLAEDGKDARGAIDWARKAYENAEGSATRVQWAIEYSKVVMRLTPADKAAVEASAGAVIDELNKNPDGYYQRTRTKVGAWGKQLRTWSEAKGGAAVLTRLQSRMSQVCAKQHDSAASCQDWAKA
jgi:protein disulfide-isomerase